MINTFTNRLDILYKSIFSEQIKKISREGNLNIFKRKRIMPLSDILLCSLNKQGLNTDFELRKYLIFQKGLDAVNITNEGHLKQRRKLNPEVFKFLNSNYLSNFYNFCKNELKNLKGYLLFEIDGTDFEVPNTKVNRDYLGKSANGSIQNTARATASSIHDLENDFFVDISIKPYKTSEIEMAKENILKVKQLIYHKKIIIMLDRNYPSLELFDFLENNSINFVVRIKKTDYKREQLQLKNIDNLVTIEFTKSRINKLKRKYPEFCSKIKSSKGIVLRMIKVKISDKTDEILVTNLLKEEFNAKEIANLYRKRWGIETSYNTLKNKIKIEAFTGFLPVFVYQDFFAQMFVYNILQDALHLTNSKLKMKISQRQTTRNKKYKNNKKINENSAIGLLKEKLIKIMMIADDKLRLSEYMKMFKEMLKYISEIGQDKPSNPRIKTLSNKYSCNLKLSF